MRFELRAVAEEQRVGPFRNPAPRFDAEISAGNGRPECREIRGRQGSCERGRRCTRRRRFASAVWSPLAAEEREHEHHGEARPIRVCGKGRRIGESSDRHATRALLEGLTVRRLSAAAARIANAGVTTR